MGRPRIQIDENLLAGLARIGCTDEEMASILGVSPDTLTRRFAEIIKKGRSEMKMSLRRLQIRLAEEGSAAMAIWLGKQNLGQHEPRIQIDVNRLDTEIDLELRRLAQLASGSEDKAFGEAESEAVN
jgi:hypothetical protein